LKERGEGVGVNRKTARKYYMTQRKAASVRSRDAEGGRPNVLSLLCTEQLYQPEIMSLRGGVERKEKLKKKRLRA